jgi:RNA polymerase sigma factor (sigma-70 family)
MYTDHGSPTGSDPEPLAPETTIELLHLVKTGDQEALARLLARCLPALRRWARGRLPQSARGMLETSGLVQDAVMASMRHMAGFEPRHQGALQAYLRQAVMNRIRDVIRQHYRRPERTHLPETLANEATSPLEAAIGAANTARYEGALQRLRPGDREAIIGRLEMQYGYEDLAIVLGKPTAAAARVAVMRAMKRFAAEIQHVT